LTTSGKVFSNQWLKNNFRIVESNFPQ